MDEFLNQSPNEDAQSVQNLDFYFALTGFIKCHYNFWNSSWIWNWSVILFALLPLLLLSLLLLQYIHWSSSRSSVCASSEAFHLPVTKQSRMLSSTFGWLQSLTDMSVIASEQSLSCTVPKLWLFLCFTLKIPPTVSSSSLLSTESDFVVLWISVQSPKQTHSIYPWILPIQS